MYGDFLCFHIEKRNQTTTLPNVWNSKLKEIHGTGFSLIIKN